MTAPNNSSPPKDQIPTEYNEEQTQRVVRKQHGYQAKEEIKQFMIFRIQQPVARILKDLHFPANKEDIIEYTEQKRSTMPESNEILSVLQQIEEKVYNNVAEITKAAGLIE